MKYKSILLTEQVYKELEAVRSSLSKEEKKSVTFSETVEKLAGRESLLLNLDKDLANYITKFVDILKKSKDTAGVILFGSVAKGTAAKYSDIDIFIIIKGSVSDYYEYAHKAIMSLNTFRYELVKKGIFNYISPTVVNIKDLEEFKPLYLDIADYGIILFDSYSIAKEFIIKTASIPHKRNQTVYGEILKWKKKG